MATYEYIELTGVIIADTEVVQAAVETGFKDTLGRDLSTKANTPQGAMITSDALARRATAENNVALANQINPDMSGGIFLDALCALFFLERGKGTPTLLKNCVIAGVAATVVPDTTTTIQDPDGNIFKLKTTVTLNGSGQAVADFQSEINAPLNVAPAPMQIVNAPLGVETVTSPSVSVLGTVKQDDAPLKSFRKETLAGQASQLSLACITAIAKVPGVTSQKFRENWEGVTRVIDGVTMVKNSLYSCVAGGTDLEVATALYSKKGGGCNFNNGPGIHASEVVVDQYSDQPITVLFDRPNLIEILLAVTVIANDSVSDPVEAVRQAVLDYAAGLIPNQGGFKVGTAVSCFEISSAINYKVPGIFVVSVFGAIDPTPPTTSATIPIAIFEQAVIQEGSITVTVLPS